MSQSIDSTNQTELSVPEELPIWQDAGWFEGIDGHNLFVHASGTAKSPGHGALLIHGFTGSPIDWKHV